MSFLINNVPHFKCWVRKEFSQPFRLSRRVHTRDGLRGEHHSGWSLSFQVVFTGCEIDMEDGPDENVHGGAMWARMPIQALVADIR